MSTTIQQAEPGDLLQAWLERVYRDRLTNNYDAVVLVVGDEGRGKSTLMLELIGRFFELKDRDPDDLHEAILDRVVWSTRQEYQEQAANSPTRSVIATPDAARVLHKKEGMVGDQREIEKDLLDIRAKEFLMLFGYQDWGVVASILQERRAHFCLRIPERGTVEAYSRAKLDDKLDMARDEWPDPDFVDKFPDLSEQAPELWDAYSQRDIEEKEQRMAADDDSDPEERAKAAQRRTAIRACKQRNLSQEEAAMFVDYSRSWVGDQVRAWDRGEIDPFGDDADNVPPRDGDSA